MAKRNHDEAPLIKAFAESRGKTVRWAQGKRKNADPEWVEFKAGRGLAVAAPGKAGELAGNEAAQAFVGALVRMADAEDPSATQAQADERRALALWRANVTAAEVAARGGDVTAAVSFTRVATETYKQYLAAKAEREADDERRRVVIPADEFELYGRAIEGVASIIRSMNRELASRCNPENPAYALAAITRWQMERLNPEIEALIEEAGRIVSA